MSDPSVTLEVDEQARAAYVRFSSAPVHRTVAHNDEINLDLDEFGMVVGIEVLRLSAEIPFADLTSRYHVDSAKVELLRFLRPSVSGFVSTFQLSPVAGSSSSAGVSAINVCPTP